MPITNNKIQIKGKEYVAVDHFFYNVVGLSYGQGNLFAREGRFPAYKYFSKWFALQEDLDNYLESCLKPNGAVKEKL